MVILTPRHHPTPALPSRGGRALRCGVSISARPAGSESGNLASPPPSEEGQGGGLRRRRRAQPFKSEHRARPTPALNSRGGRALRCGVFTLRPRIVLRDGSTASPPPSGEGQGGGLRRRRAQPVRSKRRSHPTPALPSRGGRAAATGWVDGPSGAACETEVSWRAASRKAASGAQLFSLPLGARPGVGDGR